jgi:anaerobic magnesium-protoporphyrin IX monomethyl ester cyclase
MKIAFVRPKVSIHRYIQHIPMSYIHLAADLRERGHEPFIFDMVLDGMGPEEVDRQLRLNGITVCGIGGMTFEFPEAAQEARRLKASFPDMIIVFGGAHPSGAPEECLASGIVDYVIVGEGEIALTELLDHLQAGGECKPIQGLWHKDGDRLVRGDLAPTPDVDGLPLPAYDMLDLNSYYKIDSPWYFTNSRKAVQFLSSRGCPYRCSYCHSVHGKRFRGQSPQWVLDQMEKLSRGLGIEEFIFVDDVFNFDLPRAKGICRGVVDRGLKVHLQFPNGLRGDRFDEELMALMKKAGTHFLALAIETVSPKYQKLVGKNLNIEKTMQTLLWARKYRIEVSGYFMIGFPGETLAEARQTADFAVNAPFNAIFISIVTPFKGTALRDEMIQGKFGDNGEESLGVLNDRFPIVKSEMLTPERLRRIQMNAYWRFYCRPRPLKTLIRRMANPRNFDKIVRAVKGRLGRRKEVSVN